jgi:hypothetical protein
VNSAEVAKVKFTGHSSLICSPLTTSGARPPDWSTNECPEEFRPFFRGVKRAALLEQRKYQ